MPSRCDAVHTSSSRVARGSGSPIASAVGARVARCSGLPMPVAGRSLRPSWASLARWFLRFAIVAARRNQTPAPGHGQPLASSSLADDSGGRSSRPEARAEVGDTCGRRAPIFRWRRELTSAAGAEHASGWLRRRAWQAGFRPAERDGWSGNHRRLKTCGHFRSLRPAAARPIAAGAEHVFDRLRPVSRPGARGPRSRRRCGARRRPRPAASRCRTRRHRRPGTARRATDR